MSLWLDSPATSSDISGESHHSDQLEKIFLDDDIEVTSLYPSMCPDCSERNKKSGFRYFFVNEHEAVYKCESSDCLFPFREFIFKNFTDNTVYRYQKVSQGDFNTPIELPGLNFPDNFTYLPEHSFPFKFASPKATQEPLGFDLDSILNEESDDGSVQEFSDIKDWLEKGLNVTDSPKPEQDIDRDILEAKAIPVPKKLRKSLNLIKGEPIEEESDNKVFTPLPTKPAKSTIRAADFIKTIKTKTSIWGKSATSVWASQQRISSDIKLEKQRPAILEERSEKVQKTGSARERKIKVEQEDKPSQKDPPPNVRRSQRLSNKDYHTVFTSKGIKKEKI
ncbi:uncharacterized protein LOC129803355 [Phlebotomus papatasi]|uniref:uncharacterized protein LOC129803355 n=1 Tax=Phlebotomus papatasi TaxID=29031 RepID=UPI002483D96B|nr:uncharacterized protein LOC129803355 [Phlebotomus papatasi]